MYQIDSCPRVFVKPRTPRNAIFEIIDLGRAGGPSNPIEALNSLAWLTIFSLLNGRFAKEV